MSLLLLMDCSCALINPKDNTHASRGIGKEGSKLASDAVQNWVRGTTASETRTAQTGHWPIVRFPSLDGLGVVFKLCRDRAPPIVKTHVFVTLPGFG